MEAVKRESEVEINMKKQSYVEKQVVVAQQAGVTPSSQVLVL